MELGQRAVARGKVLWRKDGHNRIVYREDIEPVDVMIVGTTVRKSGTVVPSRMQMGTDGEDTVGYLDNLVCHTVIMCQPVFGSRYRQPFAVFPEDLSVPA